MFLLKIKSCFVSKQMRKILIVHRDPSNHTTKIACTNLNIRSTVEKLFNCTSTEYISRSLVNDSVPDCFDGQDEISFFRERQFKKIHQDSCTDGTDIPCFPGDRRCFPVHKLCLFEINQDLGLGFLKNCRTGRHLENCTDFTCSHHFKCQEYYCIPWSYTCNGRTDCPLGDDEKECEDRLCKNLFKCRSTRICIHFNDVCDNGMDCLYGDDELICDLPKCPNACSCLLYAITCVSIFQFLWPKIWMAFMIFRYYLSYNNKLPGLPK